MTNLDKAWARLVAWAEDVGSPFSLEECSVLRRHLPMAMDNPVTGSRPELTPLTQAERDTLQANGCALDGFHERHMTGSRPEITARANGKRIHVTLPSSNLGIIEFSMPIQECFALQCQLAAAMEQVRPTAIYTGVQSVGIEGNKWGRTEEQPKTKTWREREPML